MGTILWGIATLLLIVPTPASSADDLWDKFHDEAHRNVRVTLDGTPGRGIFAFTFFNGNPFAIKDVGVACDIAAPSGTVLGYALADAYEIVPAAGKKAVPRLRMEFFEADTYRAAPFPDQAKSAKCTVAPFASIVELDGVPVRTEAQLMVWCTRIHWRALCP
jgi:hypothetical protein